MDAQKRTRSCSRKPVIRDAQVTLRGSRQICIPMTRETYDRIWKDAAEVRRLLDELLVESPELFPSGMQEKYTFSGCPRESKKMPGVRLRQIRVADEVYYLRPSFVFSYMTGDVDELENAMLLLSAGTPLYIVTRVCGRNDMFWHRHLERLGRCSLAGTTVRNPEKLPQHLAADEHHAHWCGEKGFIAMTVGGGCILGAALTESADEEHLTVAYGAFAAEARDIDPNYAPQTVNTDGWSATRNAFRTLFPAIATILCFLHGFLKVRDRCRKMHDLHTRIWDVYRAATEADFRQAMADFKTWFEAGSWPAAVVEMTAKLWKRMSEYAVSYSHAGCHRTSNMVDRLMNRLTRLLYAGRGLHGHQSRSELRLRGWALLQNFRPFAPRSGAKREYQSPAHRLNQKQYHENWLHNLQVCTSLAGYRQPT